MARNSNAAEINRILAETYPNAKCSLVHKTPLQLLIATILSAQCTDERVNMVTPGLFKKYRSAKAFAEADLETLCEDIRSTGFYRNKAKSIIACAQAIVEKHGGRVPKTLEELVELAGVGRKTANVVLGNVFDTPGIVVDTHVKRLSQRMGLSKNKTPEKIEQDLMKVIPQEDWTIFCHRMIDHGRALCMARKPNCAQCPLNKICPSAEW